MTSAAEAMRAIFRTAAADPEIGPAARRLEDLLDRVIAEAETAGVRYLARSIPHELGQPLAEVRGYAELVAEHDYSPQERAELLQRVVDAATRLGQMIHAMGRIADPAVPAPERQSIGGVQLMKIDLGAEERAATSAIEELRQAAAAYLQPDD